MKHTLLLIFAAFATINSSAQQYILSGQITSQKNTPVSFASVYVKNTSYGTTANENGDYRVDICVNRCLLGFQILQSVHVGNK